MGKGMLCGMSLERVNSYSGFSQLQKHIAVLFGTLFWQPSIHTMAVVSSMSLAVLSLLSWREQRLWEASKALQ